VRFFESEGYAGASGICVTIEGAREILGSSDQGIAMYRHFLRCEIKKVEEGLDPMATIRDAA
jgi:hypothetical protein